nr:hypothetical protein [Caldilinea sp.]
MLAVFVFVGRMIEADAADARKHARPVADDHKKENCRHPGEEFRGVLARNAFGQAIQRLNDGLHEVLEGARNLFQVEAHGQRQKDKDDVDNDRRQNGIGEPFRTGGKNRLAG